MINKYKFMTISFYTNYVNHHQIPLADELYRLLGDNYHYIATCNTQELISAMSGYNEINRPYIIRSYESEVSRNKAYELAINSDVLIYGTPECLPFVRARFKAGKKKLVFEVGERWLKKGLLNLLSPRLLRYKWLYHTLCPKQSAFKLCASAYSANDENLMFSFKNKCLKWGYFTAVPEININDYIVEKRKYPIVKILWVARFLKLKHPEMMLQLASILRSKSIKFSIDMIGEGPLFNNIENEISRQKLENYVHLLGVLPNSALITKMREYHIFCFTSDKKEGWGAVLNEAMSAGCCPVVNRYIGSAPFLIQNGVNGYMFDGNDLNDFVHKVEFLIENPVIREKMSLEAYKTMKEEWSPKEAAIRLVRFCDKFNEGNFLSYSSGPMSIAEIL